MAKQSTAVAAPSPIPPPRRSCHEVALWKRTEPGPGVASIAPAPTPAKHRAWQARLFTQGIAITLAKGAVCTR